jgi:sugar phosphate isomerase/epimerase
MNDGPSREVDLVYCSATELQRPFLEKVEAAAGAGFQGISLTIPDYVAAQAAGLSDADLLAAIRSSGLFVAEVSTSTRWLEGIPNEEEELGFQLVTTFGARGLNCTALNAPFRGMDEAVAAFGAICDRALGRGVRCHVEFVPWTEPHDLASAWEIVRRANRPNGGLLFDTWHFFRSGGSAEELRMLDPEKVFGVQLADAPASPQHDDPMADTFDRWLPGQGAAGVADCVRVLLDMGVRVPYGGEVPSPKWHNQPASYAAAALYQAMVMVLTRARRPSDQA